jgi:hypothetical protein
MSVAYDTCNITALERPYSGAIVTFGLLAGSLALRNKSAAMI